MSPRLASSVSGTPDVPIRHLLDKKRPPWGLKWRSHTAFILATVGVGIFTDLFLYGIIVPILPFMLRDRMQVPPEDIQSRIDYLLATYASGSVLFSPISGYFADKMPSRQLPFLVGLFALFVATFLFAIGETLWVAYVARLLQGVSAAVVWTVGMAMVLETVGAQHLGKAIGSVRNSLVSRILLTTCRCSVSSLREQFLLRPSAAPSTRGPGM
jgi:MFS family permease